MNNLETSAVRSATITALIFIFCGAWALAQGPSASARDSNADATLGAVRDLQEQVQQLRALVEEMRTENAQSRAEMQQLRYELQVVRGLPPPDSSATLTSAAPASYGSDATSVSSQATQRIRAVVSNSASQGGPALEERVQKLEESTSLLGSKVDEQFETKVESASKYRVRLSGIVLMNAFHDNGGANNIDFPDYAEPPSAGGSLATIGATLRQSEIGLEIFGPKLAGAKTSANIQMDFAGGFPATGNGINFGLVRLQTASLRLDWGNTSVIAGQDSLFISPFAPTSFASLATPTFAYGGNLWAWTPQLRVEHRFNLTDQQVVTLQAGVLDNLDWEFPSDPFLRAAQSGEQSGQPSYAARSAWSRRVFERSLSVGVAGYYGRQNWSWGRFVDAWAGMADLQIPILPRLTLSGEFYRGAGIGGLGADVGRSIVWLGDPMKASTPIRAVNDVGGWSQLKFRLTSRLEVNGAVGDDNAFTHEIRGVATDANNGPVEIFGRNRAALGNLVFRPRSDLLFAAEFRRLRSFPVYSSSSTVNQINLAMGILF